MASTIGRKTNAGALNRLRKTDPGSAQTGRARASIGAQARRLAPLIRKRSVTINGHRTSVSLEREFWAALEGIAERDSRSLASLIARIDRDRLTSAPPPGLASALRVYVLSRMKDD